MRDIRVRKLGGFVSLRNKMHLPQSASALAAICAATHLCASTLQEPLTLASESGVLDILMVARAAPISTLPGKPVGWVYQICKRPPVGITSCPADSSGAPNYYGGTLLQLQRGDLLKVHLVNQLPPVLDSAHARELGGEFLLTNPTNLHTHGLLVAPNKPTPKNPTYGDNVFVLTFNSANGPVTISPHIHSDVRYDWTDYEIKIPESHPSGLFWFHPHVHGLSLNQVSAGLSGLITVGKVDDYLCQNHSCETRPSQVRHLLLKDAQILPNGTLQDEEDPDFCVPSPQPGERREGGCNGRNGDPDGPDYTNGHWYFTLNGQRFPTLPVRSSAGEIWRITNSSGSATYDLTLWNPAQNRDMLVQVLSMDGVSVSLPAGTLPQQAAGMVGGKFKPEACPGVERSAGPKPLCTRRLHLMPSARVELWVTYRDSADRATKPSRDSQAILRTVGYQTGPAGDAWPAIDLARVDFSGATTSAPQNSLQVQGQATALSAPRALSADMQIPNSSVASDPACKPLPPGHMRRIFFAAPTENEDAFGLATEEIDGAGNVVGPPATDVEPFNPMHPTVCVPLGPGNTPAVERWELVNVAGEDHNFHIHQTRFRVLTADEIAGSVVPKGVVLDNVPLPSASGTCGNNSPDDLSNPIADWRAGLCHAKPVRVEIPFTIAGDFVYHCHILEHEDGGMMARIRVRPNR
jgi:L-ascorbate oxidase